MLRRMRILSIVTILALLLSSGVAVPAIALGEVTVSINAPAEVLPGGNFTATVNITQVANLDATNYDVSFNSAVLSLNNVTNGNIGGTSIPIDIWNERSAGTFTIVQNVPGLNGVNGTGYLAVLHFGVLGSLGQNSTISLSNGVLSSTNATVIPAIWLGDSVQVVGVAKELVSIAVAPANPSIALGLTRQFTATGNYTDNTTANITATSNWTSSNPAVATIGLNTGLATSVAAGTTTITATSGNISGNTTLTVTAPVLLSIAVTPANPSIVVGQTRQFTATGNYTNNTTANITGSANWTSSNPGVATIGLNTGLAVSVAAGNTTITATWGNISGNTTLSIGAPAPVLVSIAVTPPPSAIARSLKQQFTATGSYTNNTTANITSAVNWTSSNTSVATINTAGLATAVAAGNTTITATYGAISGNTTLLVTPATTVEVNNGNTITLAVGGNITASATAGIPVTVKGLPDLGAPVNGMASFTFNFTWNKNVIRVDSIKQAAAASDEAWSITRGVPDNVIGKVTATGFRSEYSTNDTILLYLGITAVGNTGDNTTITVGITTLGDRDGIPIPALPVTAPVMIGINLVAETSISQWLSANTTDVVVVKANINRIKNTSDNATANITGGIGSYTATVSGNASSAIQFRTVYGVSPFNNPTFDNVTGVFSVAVVASPIQASNTTVAEVVPILTGNTTTSVNLTITFQIISAASQPGLNVPEEHANTITLLRGNAKDNDAIVDINDALFIAQYIVGQRALGGIGALNAASVKHDGASGDKIDINDALFIAQLIVGQRNTYFQ